MNPELVGNNLGQFKLEYIFNKAVFLSSKVYGGVLSDGSELIKVKGLSKDSISENLNFNILENLLIENNSIQIPNIKMMRDISSGTIRTRNDLYTLMYTDNKRKLLFNNGIFSDTTPFIIKDKNIINK